MFLINIEGLRSEQFGLVVASASLGIMGGAYMNSRLSAWGVLPDYPLAVGLVLAASVALVLLAMTLGSWTPTPLFISLLVLDNVAFGLIAPNAMQAAMQSLPHIAGVVSAATGCIQITIGAAGSDHVVRFHDGHSPLSMTALMALCSVLAAAAYLIVVRPRPICCRAVLTGGSGGSRGAKSLLTPRQPAPSSAPSPP